MSWGRGLMRVCLCRVCGVCGVMQKKGSVYGACRLMDFELEMGAFVGGTPNPLGECYKQATSPSMCLH